MSRRLSAGATLAVLWLATALRFHALGAQSFWNDEGNSARLSERALRLILEGTASDIHPPLYYLILRVWRVPLGESEFALRSVSAFAGVLLVALTLALARHLLDACDRRGRATLAALLVAANPALVYYSQEARMYMLLPLWAALATWLLLRWLATQRTVWGVAYALALVAGLYTHYFFPVVPAIHAVLLLGALWPLRRAARGWLGRWALANALAGALFLPWLWQLRGGLGGNRGSAQPAADFIAQALQFLWWGPAGAALPGGVWLALLLTLLALLGAWRRPALLAALLLPPLALLALGATDRAFFKFLLLGVPLQSMALVAFDGRLLGMRAAPRLRVALIAVLLLPSLWGVRELWVNPAYARADYRGMAAQIAAEGHPAAAIVLNAPNQWEVFTYYHRAGAPVYPLPRSRDEAAVTAELMTIAAQHRRIYALYWGDQLQDPERWVERWLDAHTFKARETWVGDVRFVMYAVPAGAAQQQQTALAADFADGVRLNGYTLRTTRLRPGEIVELTLFMQATAVVGGRYKLFAHVVPAATPLAPPVAQKDGEPRQMTQTWPVGEEQIENIGILLPADLPPGAYQLRIGLYDVADPARRLLVTADGVRGDALPLAMLTVAE